MPDQNDIDRVWDIIENNSVGMDELVRETGLGKMTVYRLFKSKDDLVGAYLARKAATVLSSIDAELARCDGDPRAALLAVVDSVERDVTRSGFRGCRQCASCTLRGSVAAMITLTDFWLKPLKPPLRCRFSR